MLLFFSRQADASTPRWRLGAAAACLDMEKRARYSPLLGSWIRISGGGGFCTSKVTFRIVEDFSEAPGGMIFSNSLEVSEGDDAI